jgi:predicted dehydrogenase
MKRRTFLAATATALAVPQILNAADVKIRVGVIGHTGRGNFGHGLDTVWRKIPTTEIVSVAAKKKLEAQNGYADYREMLKSEKLDIVAVCPRHADQHHAMVMAAIDAKVAGIYIEKPFVRTPREADEIVAACKKQNVKLAVAHRNRYHPVIKTIDKFIADGELGNLLEIRGRGKGDRRGGGEDLWVLGSHVLNLVIYFGGEPRTVSAVMLQDGRHVTADDVREGGEGLGPLAGNELHSRFEMSNGKVAYFDSIANDGSGNAGFGLQLIGTKGIINIQCDKNPLAYFAPGNPFQPSKTPRPWIPFSTAGLGKPESMEGIDQFVADHRAAANDLIAAIREDRQPLCGAQQGATIVEMICGVFESHRQGGKTVSFPLVERDNALAKL